MNFLFDVINEIAGYSEKYYSELANVVDDEDLIQKYKKYRGVDPETTEEMHSRHLHCLMALEGVEILKEMKGAENRPQDYFDSLLLRLLPGSTSWYRNHFPVIMETSDLTYYFTHEFYTETHANKYDFTQFEMLNYSQKSLAFFLNKMYNLD